MCLSGSGDTRGSLTQLHTLHWQHQDKRGLPATSAPGPPSHFREVNQCLFSSDTVPTTDQRTIPPKSNLVSQGVYLAHVKKGGEGRFTAVCGTQKHQHHQKVPW